MRVLPLRVVSGQNTREMHETKLSFSGRNEGLTGGQEKLHTSPGTYKM